MKALTFISAFLGGAIVGCATALLFTPETGADLRAKIVSALRKKGVNVSDDEVDALVAELATTEN